VPRFQKDPDLYFLWPYHHHGTLGENLNWPAKIYYKRIGPGVYFDYLERHCKVAVIRQTKFSKRFSIPKSMRWRAAHASEISFHCRMPKTSFIQALHNFLLASAAPSESARSFAHAICGCTRPPRPQSVLAITFSRPTRLAKARMRSATRSGCSTTSVRGSQRHRIL
jgi:hypothetical protein